MFEEEAGVVRDDLTWCHDIVTEVSRTFSLTVSRLDAPLSHEICLGYLLCRIPDTIEDSTRLPPAEQQRLLTLYSEALAPESATSMAEFAGAAASWVPDSPSSEWETVANAPRIVDTYRRLPLSSRDVIRPAVIELTRGMALFVGRYAETGGLRIQTMAELEEYCWYVAGTVGTLVTGLLDEEAPTHVRTQLWENTRSFALLLQLVNVAKDVAVDYREENNVYLPAKLLSSEGLTASAIGAQANGEAFAPIVETVVDRAEAHLDGAQSWLDAMPLARGNSLAAWAIPFLLAVGTLRELRRRPQDVVATGSVKVSRQEVQAVLDRFGDEDPPSIPSLRREISKGPLHEA